MMHLGKKNMSKHQKMRFKFHLITILIQNQAVHHTNQHHHLLNNPYNTVGQYDLNLHALGLNHYSTFAEMIKGYRSMACRFHPDNNQGFNTTEMMKTINTVQEGLQDQLGKNDALR